MSQNKQIEDRYIIYFIIPFNLYALQMDLTQNEDLHVPPSFHALEGSELFDLSHSFVKAGDLYASPVFDPSAATDTVEDTPVVLGHSAATTSTSNVEDTPVVFDPSAATTSTPAKRQKWRKWSCSQCLYVTKWRSDLLRHQRRHSGQRFCCSQCTNKYTTKSALRSHIGITHNNPLVCQICCKTFLSKQGLYEHLKVHAGEGRYTCDICQKQFRTKAHLNGHWNKHRAYKPYQCSQCERCYTYKVSLQAHQKKCSKVSAAIICTVCDKTFKTTGALKEHKNAKHSDKIFTCQFCNARFNWRQSHSRHVKKCATRSMNMSST